MTIEGRKLQTSVCKKRLLPEDQPCCCYLCTVDVCFVSVLFFVFDFINNKLLFTK